MVAKVKKFIEKNKKIFFLSLHLLYFLFLVRVFYTDKIVIDSIFELSINPSFFLNKIIYAWSGDLFFGNPNAWNFTYIFPTTLTKLFLSEIFGLYLSQAIYFTLFIFIAYINFYFFIKNELKNKDDSFGLLIPSLFYSLNIFVAINLSGSGVLILPYIFLPLQLLLVEKVLSKNKFIYIFFLSLSFLLATSINPPTLAINIIVLFLYLFYKKITLKINIFSLIKPFFKTFFTTILINSYWIVGVFSFFTSSADYGSILSETLSMQNGSSSYLNVFRFLGLWSFSQGFGGKPYFNYSDFVLNNLVFILASFFIVIFSFSSLFFKGKNSIKYFALLLIILSMPMAVGTKEGAFASLYEWSYNNIPLFSMFRSSYKLVAVYIFAISVLMTINLVNLKSDFLKKTYSAILLFCIIVSSYPITFQKVFLDGKKVSEIPNYYKDARNFIIKDKSNFRVFLLPVQYFPVYEWGKINSHPEIFFEKSIVARQAGSENEKSNKLSIKAYNYLFNKDYSNFEKVMSVLNVKYIIQRNDFDWKYYEDISQSPEKIKEYLSPYKKIVQIGKLDIYELPSKNLGTINLQGTAEFQKINPTNYKIYLKNVKNKEDLKFLESFDKNWQLYPNQNPSSSWCGNVIEEYNQNESSVKECEPKQTFFQGEEFSYLYQKSIFENTHTMVYDYANQWTIDPDYIKQNYSKEYYKDNPDGSIDLELTLYFKPQSYFNLGLIISGTTLTACIGYLVWDFWKNRSRKVDSIK